MALFVVFATILGIAGQERAPVAFAAVSIKPFQRGAQPLVRGKNFVADPAGLHIFNRTLRQIVCYAYNIAEFQLSGGRDWVYDDAYNLDATTSAPANDDQLRAMLRSTLAERFGLALASEERPTPVLALVVAKGGPRLKALGFGEDPGPYSLQAGTATFPFATTGDMVAFFNT